MVEAWMPQEPLDLCEVEPNDNGDPSNPNRQITNPGKSIPAISEARLITAAYGASLYSKIG